MGPAVRVRCQHGSAWVGPEIGVELLHPAHPGLPTIGKPIATPGFPAPWQCLCRPREAGVLDPRARGRVGADLRAELTVPRYSDKLSR